MGSDRVLRVVEDKWWDLLSATEWVARQPCIQVRALSRLVGLWSWRFTIFRELFSIFSEVYVLISEYPLDGVAPMRPLVRQELLTLCALAPLSLCPLHLEWSSEVLMTDASEEGFGVVETSADFSEIQAEARFAERRGWITRVEAAYTMTEIEVEDDRDPAVVRGAAPPQNIWDAMSFSRPTRVLLHLYSGRRRAGDLEHYLEFHGQDERYMMVAVSVDVQVDARTGDISKPEVVAFWVDQIACGRVIYMHAGPPCSTWSRARFNRNAPGPRPVR